MILSLSDLFELLRVVSLTNMEFIQNLKLFKNVNLLRILLHNIFSYRTLLWGRGTGKDGLALIKIGNGLLLPFKQVKPNAKIMYVK